MPDVHLSPRLEQVARGIAAGKPHKRIAADTGLSLNTVRSYVRRLADLIPGSGPPQTRIVRFVALNLPEE